MKKLVLTLGLLSVLLVACSSDNRQQAKVTSINLSDEKITVDGVEISTDKGDVCLSQDIVFYLEGQGDDYGEGDKTEEHSRAEAAKHRVVNITRPGEYTITGSLSAGQIAVNLGDEAEKDSGKVVNITLDNVDITSTVAPAIICYSAYECADTENPAKDVNTSAAGFNITLAEGSVNNITGSHVAKIFDENGKKLHKYDAAIESMVSMNIGGRGELNVTADNEGIETKMHLTVNSGTININSADDSLNAGEDGVSVITINDGIVLANANGGSEGDGIDSNGWLVINGGRVSAFANSRSMDSGLDSDNGIYINGGTVFATGNMYDSISADSRQNVAVFSMAEKVTKGEYLLLHSADLPSIGFASPADYTVMVYSHSSLERGDYTLSQAGGLTGAEANGIYTEVSAVENEMMLAHSGAVIGRPAMGERPEGFTPPENGEKPEKGDRPMPPEGMGNPPEKPLGELPDKDFAERENGRPSGIGGYDTDRQRDPVFTITKGLSMFAGIAEYTE